MHDITAHLKLWLICPNEVPAKTPGDTRHNDESDEAPHRQHLERVNLRRVKLADRDSHESERQQCAGHPSSGFEDGGLGGTTVRHPVF